ncbi:Rrf2 family transcriptional regulator [Robertmurraya sp. DFI.2.37]|jgi:Rrf2 family nitric oxide-sensitive transcriptional repressor|uniref:RrF2 family transcriptional regulator n=1 Tax=Robertmurraya sp. DFI.2.37 TaxID=3031819 RepID=UPI0023D991DD|nr:Rrf2 family transcriptional regulator [Robertmurraya sp. DFI.2.37]MDF1510299.1 Rrf2 family transcriptional regulator [Robertmurraya sp. DFI.2.37]
MRLTSYSDYSFRVLIYLGTKDREKLIKITEIAEAFSISKNHLMKIIHHLGKMGYIETIRGRGGGVRLAKSPSEINVGKLVRQTEEDFHIVECFDRKNSQCVITPVCSLKHIFQNALDQFLKELDRYTLEDVVKNNIMLKDYFSS